MNGSVILNRVLKSWPHHPAKRGISKLYACFSWTKRPPIPPGPELRYLYEHQQAKSTSQSWSLRGTLPTACAKSKPTKQFYIAMSVTKKYYTISNWYMICSTSFDNPVTSFGLSDSLSLSLLGYSNIFHSLLRKCFFFFWQCHKKSITNVISKNTEKKTNNLIFFHSQEEWILESNHLCERKYVFSCLSHNTGNIQKLSSEVLNSWKQHKSYWIINFFDIFIIDMGIRFQKNERFCRIISVKFYLWLHCILNVTSKWEVKCHSSFSVLTIPHFTLVLRTIIHPSLSFSLNDFFYKKNQWST